jgi:hypothetical protein
LIVDSASEGLVPEMVRRLVADGIDVLAVVPAVEQGLEDMFLELTAREDGGERP